MSNASSTYYTPEVTDALYKYILVYRIPYTPHTVSSTVNLWIPMPTVSSWNCPVIFLFLFYLVNSSLGFRAKAKAKANSEMHFVQGGNPGTCAQRPGREEWVSIGAVPGYLQSVFVVDEVKIWQHVFFCILRGWQRKSHCVVSAQNLPNAVTKQFFAGSSLDRAAAPCGGKSCSFVL